MINFSKKPNEKIFNLKGLDLDSLIFRVLPKFLLEIMRKYFRLSIEGLENIPKRGPVIIAPNHSGYSGFDGIILNNIIQKEIKRQPRVMIHHLWFFTDKVSIPAHKLGFYEATYNNCLEELKKGNLIVLFPEGESGNFKPTTQKYQLQEFKRGFIRLAIESGATIVPTLVIGAEETHITLSNLKFTKFLRGVLLPLPLNIIPLPAKWKIKFLEPIKLPYKKDAVKDKDLMHELAEEIQENMQEQIREEIKNRGSAYW